jgi:hypothetical protein
LRLLAFNVGYVLRCRFTSDSRSIPQQDLFRTQILHGFKNSVGEAWQEYFGKFPPALKDKLVATYNL